MKGHRSLDQMGFWEIGIPYYYNYIIKRQQHANAELTTIMFEKVKSMPDA
jgi:hypothetical protein